MRIIYYAVIGLKKLRIPTISEIVMAIITIIALYFLFKHITKKKK